MYFYYLTIFLFFIPALFETSFPRYEGKITHKKIIIGGIIAICIFEMGLRWETGTDWFPYLHHFEQQDISTPFENADFGFESGYNFFVSISKLISAQYPVLLFLHALIFFLLIKKGFEYFSTYVIVSLLIFYVTFLGLWGSSRQLLAVGIGLYSLIYLYEKKWWRFALLVFLAFLFHRTSLLLLVFIFLNRNFKNSLLLIVIICSIIAGFSSLPLKIFSLFGGFNDNVASKANSYLESAQQNDAVISIIGLIKRLAILLFFFIYRNKISKKAPKFTLIFNGYFFGLCFYFIFFQTLPVMISRGSVYFNILEPLLISHAFFLAKDRKTSFIFAIIIFLYCIMTVNQSIATYPDLFDPYKSIFINTNYHRKIL